jgi:hypothetical protein
MYAYNVFLNNVRKYDVRRNGKSIIKKLYMNEMKQNSIKLQDAHFIYQSKTKMK